eukprot:CAMPEP_0197452382 /NCGR_PEP_ID=MMETSP1175-20131217/31922_1 /TAXON_ID=1003142 /ORGANISM="Triceratium dubium, Strain CCMP147" /LENGTH=39 /DNA_ID= /DNA_START= /DNA_END= /DNA_ORIENTATION=
MTIWARNGSAILPGTLGFIGDSLELLTVCTVPREYVAKA